MSLRNAGAAKLTVNAATPSRMNSRRVNLLICAFPLHELVLGGPDDQLGQPGRLGVELRVGPGPCASRLQVGDQLGVRRVLEGGRRQLVEEEIEDVLRRAA